MNTISRTTARFASLKIPRIDNWTGYNHVNDYSTGFGTDIHRMTRDQLVQYYQKKHQKVQIITNLKEYQDEQKRLREIEGSDQQLEQDRLSGIRRKGTGTRSNVPKRGKV